MFPSPIIVCLTSGFKLLALLVSVLGGFIGYILNITRVNYKLSSLRFYSPVVFSGSI